MIGGGSLGNSMFGITSFGGNGSFIGKIKKDDVGIFLQKDMVREGLQFPLGFTSPDISLQVVAQFCRRRWNTNNVHFSWSRFINWSRRYSKAEQIKGHKIAYLEGYLWDNENAKKAMKKMVDICKADNQQIAFTLSDLFCVDRHRDSFAELIKNDVDIFLEMKKKFVQCLQFNIYKDGINYAKSLNITVAITLAERGSLIIKITSY